jgi:dTDP-4-amino-4,6-dideoxygalactose transaminase
MAEKITIPFTNLHQQYVDCREEIDAAIAGVISSSSYITGPDVSRFESIFADYVQAEDCASTGSGTTALMCALRALGIGAGDEVLTTPHTFVATTEAIVSVGAVPVFVDIDPRTHLVDLVKLQRLVTARTRAILFVDIYGQCPNIDVLQHICKMHNLYLVEDAAHSIGNTFHGRPVGSFADITCFSFNPVKNLGAMGDAGCCTGSRKLMDQVRMYRDHGRVGRYNIVEVGYNARIDNMQSAVVLAKLPYLAEWLRKKKIICETYSQELASVVQVPTIEPGNSHSYYVYVIQTSRRDALQHHLASCGIQTNIHYATTTHRQPAYVRNANYCPIADNTVREILSLPCWYSMSESQIQYVIDSVKAFFS